MTGNTDLRKDITPVSEPQAPSVLIVIMLENCGCAAYDLRLDGRPPKSGALDIGPRLKKGRGVTPVVTTVEIFGAPHLNCLRSRSVDHRQINQDPVLLAPRANQKAVK